MHIDPYLSISTRVKENKPVHVLLQNRIQYTVYTYYWKVTMKDFILSNVAGLQLTTLLKMYFLQVFFNETNFLETPL